MAAATMDGGGNDIGGCDNQQQGNHRITARYPRDNREVTAR